MALNHYKIAPQQFTPRLIMRWTKLLTEVARHQSQMAEPVQQRFDDIRTAFKNTKYLNGDQQRYIRGLHHYYVLHCDIKAILASQDWGFINARLLKDIA